MKGHDLRFLKSPHPSPHGNCSYIHVGILTGEGGASHGRTAHYLRMPKRAIHFKYQDFQLGSVRRAYLLIWLDLLIDYYNSAKMER